MLRTTRTSRGARVGAVVMSLALVAAACGGDDDESSDADEPAESTEEPADEPADEAEEPADEPAEEPADEPAEEPADEPADTAAEEPAEEPASDATTVRWFVGLGTGSQDEQIDRQQALVDEFNSTHDDIQIEVEFVPNETAAQTLATQIAAGNAPDIIGPVGREGSNSFAGQYLDLDPLIESTGYDLSIYPAAQVEAWVDDDGALRGLPFASYPSAIFFNTELFDAAGLPYPPQEYGPDGTAVYGEGTEYEGTWDWAKVEEIGKLMTIDSAGLNATEEGFDKDDTVQWGYIHQWTEPPMAQGTFFGAGKILQDDGTAKIPEQWVEEWNWYHAAKHESGFVPDQTEIDSDLLAGNAFNSGKVAMANTHQWYTCCLFDGDGNAAKFWDLAIVPSYEGNVVSKLHADIFRIHKDTANPDEAFEVLTYFQDDIALDLLTIYGAMPARPDIQADYFAGLDATFDQGVNWNVIVAGGQYPDVPSHESYMPAYLESLTLIEELEGEISGDPTLDVDARAAEIEAQLNEMWAAAEG